MTRLPRPANAPTWFTMAWDGLERIMRNFMPSLLSYTVATLPDAAANAFTIVHVSDESGGPTLAYSDGADWLRATDNAVVS